MEADKIVQGVGHVHSHHYHAQIKSVGDVAKVRDPVVTHVELILRDISTICNDPPRILRWVAIARKVIAGMAAQ